MRIFVGLVLSMLLGLRLWTGAISAQDNDLPYYQSSPSARRSTEIECNELKIVGQEEGIPSGVTFEVRAVDEGREMEGYRYHFGDGIVREFGSDGDRYRHEYNQPGTYYPWVEVSGRNERWFSSPECTNIVEVEPVLNQVRVQACLGVDVNDIPHELAEQKIEVDEAVKLSVRAMDSHMTVAEYRLSFGDERVEEQVGNVYLHKFNQDGVYKVTAEMLPADDEVWVGGEELCSFELVIGDGDGEELTAAVSENATEAYGVGEESSSSSKLGLILAGVMLMVGLIVTIWLLRRT